MSDLLCPSAHFSTATVVVGAGSPGKRLVYERRRRPPDTEDSDMTTSRLAGPCQMSSCDNWKGSCELGSAISETGVQLRLGTMPRCLIRNECRWFAENGRAACGACALVRYAN